MRNTTVNVSAYVRDREHQVRLMRGDTTTITVEFGSTIPAGGSLASVQWRMVTGYPVAMTTAAISGTKATIRVSANQQGEVMGKVIGTLASGDKVSQSIRFIVRGGPYFNGETTPAPGVLSLNSP